jgi:hypothetical protein
MLDKDQLKKWLAGVVAIGAGVLLSACSASAAPSNSAGGVTLNPSSGSVNSTPTWSTSTACASGFQGSAIFREVHSDGTTTNTISPVINGTAAPFHGTLQASIARVQGVSGVPKGGTQKLVVLCFSGPSLTGKSEQAMSIYVKYSADGTTYTTSSTQ